MTHLVFRENHVAIIKAKENNSWKLTLTSPLDDVQRACMEYEHGRLWNLGYNVRDVVSIKMESFYPISFKVEGEAKPHLRRFAHPMHRLVRVSINHALPADKHWICRGPRMEVRRKNPPSVPIVVWEEFC